MKNRFRELFQGPVWIGLIAFWFVLAMAAQLTRDLLVEVDIEASATGAAKVYFDDGSGFREANTGMLHFSSGENRTLLFRLPAERVEQIRLDPTDRRGRIVVRAVRWEEPWPGGSGTLDPEAAVWEGGTVENPGGGAVEITAEDVLVPDPRAIWNVKIGWSSGEWWTFRILVAFLAGVFAVGASWFWNRRIERARGCFE